MENSLITPVHNPYNNNYSYESNTISHNGYQTDIQHFYSSAGLDISSAAPLTSNQQQQDNVSYFNSYEQCYQQQEQSSSMSLSEVSSAGLNMQSVPPLTSNQQQQDNFSYFNSYDQCYQQQEQSYAQSSASSSSTMSFSEVSSAPQQQSINALELSGTVVYTPTNMVNMPASCQYMQQVDAITTTNMTSYHQMVPVQPTLDVTLTDLWNLTENVDECDAARKLSQEADLLPSSNPKYFDEQSIMSHAQVGYNNSLSEDFLNSDINSMIMGSKTTQQQELPTNSISPSTTSSTTTRKRKRNPRTSMSIPANSTIISSGLFKCIPCEKEFTRKCYLTQHNKFHHSGVYPFRCDLCGKRFQDEDLFKIHQTKHKGIAKDHKCQFCPKQYHYKTDLKRHIDTKHTHNNLNSCDICNKSFRRKDHLRKHLAIHNRTRALEDKKSLAAPDSLL